MYMHLHIQCVVHVQDSLHTLLVCESWAQTGSNYMGEDRVAVLLFYHTLCLIHASKHFTNCALHELFHFHTTQFWVTLLYTRVVDL